MRRRASSQSTGSTDAHTARWSSSTAAKAPGKMADSRSQSVSPGGRSGSHVMMTGRPSSRHRACRQSRSADWLSLARDALGVRRGGVGRVGRRRDQRVGPVDLCSDPPACAPTPIPRVDVKTAQFRLGHSSPQMTLALGARSLLRGIGRSGGGRAGEKPTARRHLRSGGPRRRWHELQRLTEHHPIEFLLGAERARWWYTAHAARPLSRPSRGPYAPPGCTANARTR